MTRIPEEHAAKSKKPETSKSDIAAQFQTNSSWPFSKYTVTHWDDIVSETCLDFWDNSADILIRPYIRSLLSPYCRAYFGYDFQQIGNKQLDRHRKQDYPEKFPEYVNALVSYEPVRNVHMPYYEKHEEHVKGQRDDYIFYIKFRTHGKQGRHHARPGDKGKNQRDYYCRTSLIASGLEYFYIKNHLGGKYEYYYSPCNRKRGYVNIEQAEQGVSQKQEDEQNRERSQGHSSARYRGLPFKVYYNRNGPRNIDYCEKNHEGTENLPEIKMKTKYFHILSLIAILNCRHRGRTNPHRMRYFRTKIQFFLVLMHYLHNFGLIRFIINNNSFHSMKELVEQIKAEFEAFVKEADAQVEKGNKAAGTRARKSALALSKMMKDFRKVSVEEAKK